MQSLRAALHLVCDGKLLTHLPRHGHVFWQRQETAVAQKPRPQLNADNTEYEEDEETQQQNVAQHR